MDSLDKSVLQQAIAAVLVSDAKEATDCIKHSVLGRRIIVLWVLRCAEDMLDGYADNYTETVLSASKRMLEDNSTLNTRIRLAETMAALTAISVETASYSRKNSLLHTLNCVEASVDKRVTEAEKAAYVAYSAVCAVESACHDLLLIKRTPVEETEERQREYLLDILNQHLNT